MMSGYLIGELVAIGARVNAIKPSSGTEWGELRGWSPSSTGKLGTGEAHTED